MYTKYTFDHRLSKYTHKVIAVKISDTSIIILVQNIFFAKKEFERYITSKIII